jgi:hypothetical protein
VMNCAAACTVTFPAVSSTIFAPGMGVRVTNQSVSVVTISTTPAINNYPGIGTAGCQTANTCYIPQYGGLDVVANAAGSLDSSALGASVPKDLTLTWGPGQNLAAATLPMAVFSSGHIVLGIQCILGAAEGGSATIKIWTAASGTALGSGTDLTSGHTCDANSTANTAQTGLLNIGASTVIPAVAATPYGIGAVGTGFGTTNGSGAIKVAYQ